LTFQRDVVLSYSASSSQRRILEVPDPEDEGTALSETAVRHSPNKTASHCRRSESSATQL